MTVKFHVTAPDGHTLEIEGPDGATQEQAIAEAQRQYSPPPTTADKIQRAQAGMASQDESPVLRSGHATSEGLDMAMGQTGKFLGGVAGAVTGIPGGIYDTLKAAAQGKGTVKDIVGGASKMVHSALDPVSDAISGVTGYGGMPTDEQFANDAKTAGSTVGQGAVALALPKIFKAGAATPEELQGIANKAKAYREANPTTLSSIDLTKPTTVLRPAINAGARVVEAGASRLARAKSARGTVMPAPGQSFAQATAADESRRMAQVAGNPDYTPGPDVMHPEVTTSEPPAQRPGLSPNDQAFMDSLQNKTPSHTEIAADEESRIRQAGNQDYEPGPDVMHPEEPTPAAAPPSPGVSASDQAFLDDLRKHATGNASDNVPQMEEKPPVVEPKPELPINADLQAVQDRMQNPRTGEPSDAEVKLANDALTKAGRITEGNRKARVGIATNAPFLLRAFPELRGLPAGDTFNTALANATNTVGSSLKAVEESIPDNTPVHVADASAKLGNIADSYAAGKEAGPARAIADAAETMKNNPSMPWGDFIKMKRAFFEKVSLSSSAGKQAYGIFKDVAGEISPKLNDLNQKYFTAKTAVEHAAIDLKTGKPVMPAKLPAVPREPRTRAIKGPLGAL